MHRPKSKWSVRILWRGDELAKLAKLELPIRLRRESMLGGVNKPKNTAHVEM